MLISVIFMFRSVVFWEKVKVLAPQQLRNPGRNGGFRHMAKVARREQRTFKPKGPKGKEHLKRERKHEKNHVFNNMFDNVFNITRASPQSSPSCCASTQVLENVP